MQNEGIRVAKAKRQKMEKKFEPKNPIGAGDLIIVKRNEKEPVFTPKQPNSIARVLCFHFGQNDVKQFRVEWVNSTQNRRMGKPV